MKLYKGEEFTKLRKEFMKNSVAAVIIQVIYPSVLLHLQMRFPDKEQFASELFRLGQKLADKYLEDGNLIKTKNFEKYIKTVFRKFLQNKKVRVRKIDDDTYNVEDRDCVLCGGTEIEGIGIHICTPFSGFFQKLLNTLIPKEKYKVQEFRVRTIASKWMNSPACIHRINLVRGG